MERGQFNTIAFLLCLLSIYLYHFRHRSRYLAYLLFSVPIQLKVFPAIFIVMFVRDWRDWRDNLKRFIGLAAFNMLLLFVLGYRNFTHFLAAIRQQMLSPYVWIGNHSFKSFVTLLSENVFQGTQSDPWASTAHYLWLLQPALLAYVAVCLLVIVFKAYKQGDTGLDPLLLLACAVGALVIPSVSHDYKLSILSAPVAIALCAVARSIYSRLRILASLLISLISIAYSTTLFSFTNKPVRLANNLFALMVILLICTLLAVLRPSGHDSGSLSRP